MVDKIYNNMDNDLNVLEELVDDKYNATPENKLASKNVYTDGVAGDGRSDSTLSQETIQVNLDSVQKYAGRIKSFLGWETDEGKVTEDVSNLKENVPDSERESANITNECSISELNDNSDCEINRPHIEDQQPESQEDNGESFSFQEDSVNNEVNIKSNSALNDDYNDAVKVSLDIDIVEREAYISNVHEENEAEFNSKLNITESEIDEKKCDLPLQNEIINEDHLIQTVSEMVPTDETVKTIPDTFSTEDDTTNQRSASINLNLDISHVEQSSLTNINETNEKVEEQLYTSEISDEKLKHEYTNNLEDDFGLEKYKNTFNLENVRRFSREIVKDVIHSARSSIMEMLINDDKIPDIEDNIQHTLKCEEDLQEIDKYKDNLFNFSEINSEADSVLLTSVANILVMNNAPLAGKICEEDKCTDTSDDTLGQKANINDENLQIDEETLCTLCGFKPKWIQVCARSEVYLFLYSIIGILLGNYSIYLIGTFSTLEKRFAFKSKISGTILVVDEFVPLFLGIFVGYFGGKAHRPRMIAFGMLMAAACCFVSSLPYFIYGPAQHLTVLNKNNETGPEFCDTKMDKESCNVDEQPPTLSAVLLFIFASFMKGFGNLAFLAIGLPYLDDNSKKKNSPLYIAIALALRLLGPLVGFLMSSAFLKFYENPFDDPGFGPDDPRWIGAWWMGFVLQGILLLLFTLPIAMFPRRLPSQTKPVQTTPAKKESFKELFVGLFAALKRLAKNPLFVFITLKTTMVIFGHIGHYIMLPKYMENQFRLSASDASLLSGPPAIGCIMVSTVFGGFIIWKFRPTAKLLITGMIASEILLAVGYLTLSIPRCQSTEMSHFGMNEGGLILDGSCNKNCDCSTTAFTPFCDPNGKTLYFSPCYAGCTAQKNSSLSVSKESKVFENCSCVTDVNGQVGGNITEGFCPDENCWSQTLAYIILLLVLHTISSTLTVGDTMILLRSVHPDDKSVALGTFETLICLFGFIPFPVTFGALVDSACLVWEKSCDETGNCWFYDMAKYNYLLHGAASFFCILSSLCLVAMYFFSGRVRDLYAEDDDEIYYDKPIKIDTVSDCVTKL